MSHNSLVNKTILNLLLISTIFCAYSCKTNLGGSQEIYAKENTIIINCSDNYFEDYYDRSVFDYATIYTPSNFIDNPKIYKYVYRFCKTAHLKNYNTVNIVFNTVAHEDKYGNKEYEQIKIGKIDPDEVIKYKDLHHFEKSHVLFKLFDRYLSSDDFKYYLEQKKRERYYN